MKKQIRRWFGYCLDGLVLLTAAGWGLIGSGRWDEVNAGKRLSLFPADQSGPDHFSADYCPIWSLEGEGLSHD